MSKSNEAEVVSLITKEKSRAMTQRRRASDPAVVRRNEVRIQNRALLRDAIDTCKRIKCNKLFLYIDAIDEAIVPESLPDSIELIVVTKRTDFAPSPKLPPHHLIIVPKLKLGRLGHDKIAIVLALSNKSIKHTDRVVFVLGKAEHQTLDTLLCLRLDEENELLTGHGTSDLPHDLAPSVFENVLNLAIELGNKGKEGKAVGTIFVLGDEEKVMQLSRQMIINPFKGYEPDERNVLNPSLKETLRELSSVDGAFVIAGNGEIIAAGRYLGASTEEAEIPRGLGSRHMAAAGITALTNAIAIVISESTGDVRIFKNGNIIMAIEKPTHK